MAECLECGKEFDSTKRTGTFWKKQYAAMGAMADICDSCWKVEHGINVENR